MTSADIWLNSFCTHRTNEDSRKRFDEFEKELLHAQFVYELEVSDIQGRARYGMEEMSK